MLIKRTLIASLSISPLLALATPYLPSPSVLLKQQETPRATIASPMKLPQSNKHLPSQTTESASIITAQSTDITNSPDKISTEKNIDVNNTTPPPQEIKSSQIDTTDKTMPVNTARLTTPETSHIAEKQQPLQGIVRINDCLLIATIYSGNWNVECMRSGSSDPESWEPTWHPTPMTQKIVPKDVWPVCTWLNGFGYEEIINTPSLDLDPKLGPISRVDNVYLYHHGYEVSGGTTLITQLGSYCPVYGKNVHPAKQAEKSWVDYIPL